MYSTFYLTGPLKIAANIYMILLMGNDVLAHTQIKDGHQRMSLPIVFILLLSCRLVVYYQEMQREKTALADKQKQQQDQQQRETTENDDAETKKTK